MDSSGFWISKKNSQKKESPVMKMQRYFKIDGKGWYFKKSDDCFEGPFSSRVKAKAAYAKWRPTVARKTLVVRM